MKSARYQDMRDELFSAVDDEWAEPIELKCMRDGQIDPTRPPVEFEAILRTEDEGSEQITGGRDKNWISRVTRQPVTLSIDRAAWPDLVIQKGDKVRAVARPGKPWFEVLSNDDRSHRRLILHLGAV